MLQFNQSQLESYRVRLTQDNSIISWMKHQVKPLVDYGILAPSEGIATWSHYYYCSKHSVPLSFELNSPEKHVCPVDGEVLMGEPYDGAWWRIVNGLNAQGCYYFSLLWIFTQERQFLEMAKEILLKYAQYYPNYKVHGGIPYNGPGKANAQTLCEAMWLRPLALGYDLIVDSLTLDEQAKIETDLLTPGAEFLKEHRTPQLHNHEVIINTAMGILGILLRREDIIEYAVHAKYGLEYQLENGLLKDGFWFEGSIGYHFFALESFLAYEKFAYYTPYRLNHPRLPAMLQFPLKLIQPDYQFPLLNDASYGEKDEQLESIYEFGFREYGNPEFGWLLNRIYQDHPRQASLAAFLYGVARLPETRKMELTHYHDAAGSGLTIFRGSNRRYLLVKHGPFGGEHDHYDRLGISFLAFGERIAPDLGTTGYGAKLHYDYYKNTGSHNTVMINEENQPPADGKVLRFVKRPDYILLDTEVKWDGCYPGLDSHTIVQWDEQSYTGVAMRRVILWCDHYFVEVFKIEGVKDATIDWVLHIPGKLAAASTRSYPGIFSKKKPFTYLKNIQTLNRSGVVKSSWLLQRCQFNLYSYSDATNLLLYADGPDNPSTGDISYFINRVRGKQALFVNLWEVVGGDDSGVRNVDCRIEREVITVSVVQEGQTNQYPIRLE